MGVTDKVKIKRQRNTTIVFPRFGEVDLKGNGNAGKSTKSEYSVGFDLSDGALKSGVGIGEMWDATLPEKCVGLWFYKRDNYLGNSNDRLIAMGVSGKMYEKSVRTGPFYLIDGLEFSSKPEGVCYNYNGNDVIIFASSEDGVFIYDGNDVSQIQSAPTVTSACIHYERLFVTVKGGKTLWFSDDFDPTNWSVSLTEAGFIDMVDYRGEMLKTLSFLGYLYLFRSYGITRITAYGKQEEFTVSDIFTSSGKIRKDSITICGDRIIFLASDGFYSFNGLSATRILSGLDGFVDYSYEGAKGMYFDGKVYFKARIFKDGTAADALMVFDISKGSYYFIEGLGIVDIQLIGGRLVYDLAILNDIGRKILHLNGKGSSLGTPYVKKWRSKSGDLGIKAKKNLNEITLYASSNVTLEISCDGKTSSFPIKGGEGIKTVRPNLVGYKFGFTITCNEEDAEISALTAKFGYYL